MGFIAESVAFNLEQTTHRRVKLLKRLLGDREKLIAFQVGETHLPFLVRNLPIVWDVKVGDLIPTRQHLVVVTNARVLIVRLARSTYTGHESIDDIVAAIALHEVVGVIPEEGINSSSITIRTQDGQGYQLANLDPGAPTSLFDAFEYALTRRVGLYYHEWCRMVPFERQSTPRYWWVILFLALALLALVGWMVTGEATLLGGLIGSVTLLCCLKPFRRR